MININQNQLCSAFSRHDCLVVDHSSDLSSMTTRYSFFVILLSVTEFLCILIKTFLSKKTNSRIAHSVDWLFIVFRNKTFYLFVFWSLMEFQAEIFYRTWMNTLNFCINNGCMCKVVGDFSLDLLWKSELLEYYNFVVTQIWCTRMLDMSNSITKFSKTLFDYVIHSESLPNWNSQIEFVDIIDHCAIHVLHRSSLGNTFRKKLFFVPL